MDTTQHTVVFKYLMTSKRESCVKNFEINDKGIINLNFFDHQKALAFYKETNFSDKFLVRPFNMYFDL